MTTPGPVGLAALWVAARTALPLVGSFHTDLTAYATTLSGSIHLGRVMARYLRWVYARCDRVLVPSASTGELLRRLGALGRTPTLWTRGVDTTHFTPARRSASLRERWRVSADRPALL
jgi:glycosyltransferase involved in cell wall biosynthesis